MHALHWNEKDGRYIKDVDGHIVYANARHKDGVLFIDYVYTPPELRGTGQGSAFMKDLMAHAQAESMKVKPICGFAAGWLRKHEGQYQDLMA